MKLPESKLTKRQTKVFGPRTMDSGETITAKVRFDDDCSNGHNSFAITADIKERGRWVGGGCCHDEIAEYFPELAPFIKWHLTSTDGPMHYVANTVYRANPVSKHKDSFFVYLSAPDLGVRRKLLGLFNAAEVQAIRDEFQGAEIDAEENFNSLAKDAEPEKARKAAIWPDATLDQLQDEKALMARLPALMAEFKADVESLGFEY